LLILTIIIAPEIKGSRSWIVLTPYLRFQSAEFAKFATLLALAKFMNSYEFYLLKTKNFLTSACIILLPMLLIILQREAGTALVFVALALIFYREGMSGYVLLTSICAVLFFVIKLKYDDLLWHHSPVGELIVACMILVITYIVLRFVLKRNVLSNYFLGIIALTGTIAYMMSFSLQINLVWVAVALVAGFSIYLVMYSIKKIEWSYALLALFATLSIGFLFSSDYVFDNMLEPHQQQRIKVSLGLVDDPSGAGYNVNQSKIAIGSGGFSGKGFLNGTQTKLKYVPEHATDFIFCTVGEEFGFLGSSLLILIYCIFLLRMIVLAERQDSTFGRVYGYGVVSFFLFHVFINIGMVTGLTPVIGIPLPFFSYGGSSLLGFTILLFIFLRIDSGRKEEH
jgi:rod shape determining protein RodA